MSEVLEENILSFEDTPSLFSEEELKPSFKEPKSYDELIEERLRKRQGGKV